jgi:hypothetical protein
MAALQNPVEDDDEIFQSDIGLDDIEMQNKEK